MAAIALPFFIANKRIFLHHVYALVASLYKIFRLFPLTFFLLKQT